MRRGSAGALALVLGTLAGCADGPPQPAEAWWRPDPGLTWQYQLTGALDPGVAADVYDLDPDAVPAEALAALQDGGARVLCYVSVGSLETWRDDAADLPSDVVGEPLAGWPDERWLDVRRRDVLVPWVRERLRRCAEAGFDGVELDNVDAYANRTGFPLTEADSLAYAHELVDAAHAAGLAVAWKNAPELVDDLAGEVDLAVVEECFAEGSCADYRPLLDAGKPVLAVEYGPVARHCASARAAGISLIGKELDLPAARERC